MQYKENLQRLFDKDMTRRDFLAHIGTGLLVLVGIKGLMSHLFGQTERESSQGYGVSRYGQ